MLPGLTHLALRAGDPEIVERVWAAVLEFLRSGLEPAAGAAAAP